MSKGMIMAEENCLDENCDGKWRYYNRIGGLQARPYVPGEALSGVSVSAEDTPEGGGMIARNPENEADQWYVNADYFSKNYASD